MMVTFTSKIINGREVMYIAEQAEGALPNGSRFVKVAKEEGDVHQIGDEGTVIGSLDIKKISGEAVAKHYNSNYFYFVEWDTQPGIPIGILEFKIRGLERR